MSLPSAVETWDSLVDDFSTLSYHRAHARCGERLQLLLPDARTHVVVEFRDDDERYVHATLWRGTMSVEADDYRPSVSLARVPEAIGTELRRLYVLFGPPPLT